MAMNRFTPGPKPDPPPAPPAKRPDFHPPGQGVQPAAGANPARRRCDHCGRWNEGTTCDGCGAPIDWSERRTRPAVAQRYQDRLAARPGFPMNRIVK